VALLLAKGADPNQANNSGVTPCFLAALEGHVDVLALLLAKGADPNKSVIFDGVSTPPYYFAAAKGHVATVRLLVARGASPRAIDADTPPELAAYIYGARNWTPLHRAADARDFDALWTALPRSSAYHHAKVESEHPQMRTALGIAGSDAYPCAAPVDERCLALVRGGPVWSVATHSMCPADEQAAARARALMMGGRRTRADGTSYLMDIGPLRLGGAPFFVPRDIWATIFSFLLFEEGY